MSDQEYHHVVDQIKGDIREIKDSLIDLRERVVGNGNPEGSLCWDVADIKREIAPFGQRPFRQVVAECYSYVKGFKMTWSKVVGIVLFLMQGVILAYLTGLIPKHP